MLFALLTAPLLAVPEPTAEELQANREQVDQWRKHPEQLARLRRDLQTFLALPDARREQILKVDYDLQEQSTSDRARLLNVLERYSQWLEQLPETDRQAVEGSRDPAKRLALIQELRDR